MNPSYDTDAASVALEKLAQERATERLTGLQLADHSVASILEWAKVVECTAPSSKRLARCDAEGSETEIVWHLQGVLTSSSLPPFTGRGRSKDKAKYIRQSVRLSGLDTDTFNRAIRNIGAITAVFSRTVSAISPSTFVETNEGGCHLDASNRFFTSVQEGTGEDAVPISSEIDPTGMLAKLGGQNYYHGEENKVSYLERKHNRMTGKKSTNPIPPVAFKLGDIVEVQLTFMLVPIKGADWKIVAMLRCLTLLDGRFATDMIRMNIDAGFTARQPGSSSARTLKRRVGADLDEEGDDTIAKISRMDLSGNCVAPAI